MHELNQKAKELEERLGKIGRSFNLEKKKYRLKELEAASTEPDLWDDRNKARGIMQELGDLKKETESFEDLSDEIKVLVELSNEEDLSEDIAGDLKRIEKELNAFELKTFLSGLIALRRIVAVDSMNFTSARDEVVEGATGKLLRLVLKVHSYYLSK